MLQATAAARVCGRSRDAAHAEAAKRVIAEIRSRLNEPLNLKRMADIAYLSPFHFNRVFKNLTGVPPIQFLYALRLERAKELLRSTDLSVTNICLEVGYNSLGSFTNRFTELVGLSPNAYRRFACEFGKLEVDCVRGLLSTKRTDPGAGSSVAGDLVLDGCADGLLFVGLFSHSKPGSWPVAYELMASSGEYRFCYRRRGCFRVHGVGFPRVSSTGDLLDLNGACRARSERISIQPERVARVRPLSLRPVNKLDPPILGVVPLLLISGLLGQEAAGGAKYGPVSRP